MTPPRDPDEVDQTLLPDAPAKAPVTPRGAPAKPAKPATDTPGPFDATVDIPLAPSVAPADPGETLVGSARTGLDPVPPAREKETKSDATADGAEPTLLP